MQTNEETTNLILEAIRGEVDPFVKAQGAITSATEYEDKVLVLSRKFASSLIAHSAGQLPKSRNAKKKS